MDSHAIKTVIKLDGTKRPIQFDAILHRITEAAEGLNNVEPAWVSQKVINGMVNNMTTTELDNLVATTCGYMIDIDTEYDELAVRIMVSRMHKVTTAKFTSMVEMLYKDGRLTQEFYDDVLFLDKTYDLNTYINKDYDFKFKYFGLCTLKRNGYLLESTTGKQELPCYMYMRLAVFMYGRDLTKVLNVYEGLSKHEYIHASPTLFHAGTKLGTLISCFLLSVNDDIKDIAAMQSKCMVISKGAGGIGVNVTSLRGRGSLIQSSGGKSNGVIPWMKILNEIGKAVNQGGKRPGAIAIYMEPWHCDVEEFLETLLPTTHNDMRTDSLFIAIWMNDLFMKRLESQGDWSLMSPDECPGLVDSYGPEFEALYLKYEAEGRARKTIPARKIWDKILKSLIEKGQPYIVAKDAVNIKNAQSNRGTIRGSNLCAEIVEFSSNDEVACCNLASICLPTFLNVETKTIDYKRLMDAASSVTENLNQIIDKTVYPHEHARKSNLSMRPIALGVQGLSDVLQGMGIPFESPHALAINQLIFESIYYGAVRMSIELAKRHGPYEHYEGSTWSKGQFQFDLWAQQNQFNSNKLMYNWSDLRNDLLKYGIRNSLTTSVMPTASTAQILASTECIEPPHANFYSRRVKAGEFMIFNNHLMTYLKKAGLWTDRMKQDILLNNGSIQSITDIPCDVKKIYKCRTEVSQKSIIDMAVSRAPFIDQTQSMNLFFDPPDASKLTASLMYGWKCGLKTLIYYNRTQSTTKGVTAKDSSTTQEHSKKHAEREQRRIAYLKFLKENPDNEVCTSCTG